MIYKKLMNLKYYVINAKIINEKPQIINFTYALIAIKIIALYVNYPIAKIIK